MFEYKENEWMHNNTKTYREGQDIINGNEIQTNVNSAINN